MTPEQLAKEWWTSVGINYGSEAIYKKEYMRALVSKVKDELVITFTYEITAPHDKDWQYVMILE